MASNGSDPRTEVTARCIAVARAHSSGAASSGGMGVQRRVGRLPSAARANADGGAPASRICVQAGLTAGLVVGSPVDSCLFLFVFY